MSEKKINRGKKMTKDFLVYSIGSIGSKLMTFLLLPLYTHYITPSEYGYYDQCFTACFLLMPILTLQLRDGIFRFLLDTEDTDERTRIVTMVNKTLLQTTAISLLIALAVYFVYPFKYLEYITILLVGMSFYDVYAQTVRGLGNNRSFIAMSLISSFGIVLLSILFVVILGMKVPGIFLANILARVAALLIVEAKEKALKRFFNPKLCDYKELRREILKFSIPLLPAGICWWFIGLSNRYFITNYMSLHETGIYGVASRLAIVVHTISTVFMQTWQENAIQQYHSSDRDHFFSKIFNGYIFSFVLVILLYTFAAKLVFPYLFNADYLESFKYLYPLCISTMLFALAGYFEVIYQCEKNTQRLVPPFIAAPIVNVVLNYLLIGPLGINGVILSYAATYLLLTAYRWYDVRKHVKIRFYKISFIPVALLIAGAIPFIFKTNILIDIAIMVASVASLFISSDFRNGVIGKFKAKLARK